MLRSESGKQIVEIDHRQEELLQELLIGKWQKGIWECCR